MSDFWTTERIQQLLGESDKWPQLTVEDGGAELYLDGEQSRFSLIDEKGFAYGWIPGEKLARLCAAAPAALAWCVDAIETAYSLANSYATTNEAQRRRAEIAEMSLEMIEADNRNLEDAHKRISELEREREEAVTDSEFATLENIKLRERLLEAELAAIPWDAMEKMQGCEAHTYDTELAKIQVHNWARGHRPRTPNIVP